VGPIELESIKFSTKYLGSSLIMVLGHQNCGAIKAVLDGTTEDIPAIAEIVEPGVKRLPRSGNRLKNGIIANVRYMVSELKKKPTLKAQLDSGQIKICGGYYNFETGEVEIVSEL
jgi:carbonic anhydrase